MNVSLIEPLISCNHLNKINLYEATEIITTIKETTLHVYDYLFNNVDCLVSKMKLTLKLQHKEQQQQVSYILLPT